MTRRTSLNGTTLPSLSDIYNRQFTRRISLLPEQCDSDQIVVLGPTRHVSIVAAADAGRVAVHE